MITELTVNGDRHRLDVPASENLLTTLRDRLGLTGGKLACGRGECGACTVLIDGTPRNACITLTTLVRDGVTTVEGLADEMAVLRECMADEGGLQCGYCTPGQIVRAATLVRERVVEPASIRAAMSGNICRCTGYTGIVRAVAKAARAYGGAAPSLGPEREHDDGR